MKKIAVFTGTRAEYGLLSLLMRAIEADKSLELQLIVSGTHLSPEFGNTIQEILNDGFKVDKKIEVILSSDSSVGVSKAMGLGLLSYSEALEELKPDLVVVLGDRFETFAMAIAAYNSKIPIAHLHGGEITEGALDDVYRHCISKLSHLHFASTEEYKNRIIQLGEHPDRVFNVGAIGVDAIKSQKLLNKKNLEKKLNIKFSNKNYLVTLHPETLNVIDTQKQISELLKALSSLKDSSLFFTKANADEGGRVINKAIEEFVSKNKNAFCFASLGRESYLSLANVCDATIGNSSSGLIEVPYFEKSTINVGSRQKGRLKPKSVIDSVAISEKILSAIKLSQDKKHQSKMKNMDMPYGKGGVSKNILEMIKKIKTNDLKKSFWDLK